MEQIEKKDNKLVFKAEIEDSLANIIRRYLNEINVLAIDEVEIFKNDSSLYDETVAHRIGLIPLKMDKSMDKKTNIQLKLVAEKEGNVVSGEFAGKVKPVYENIPITILNKGQELEIVGNARIGKGTEHAKFSPGLMYYRNVQELTLDKDLMGELKNVFPNCEIKEKGNKIVIIDNGKKEIADVIEGIAEKKGKKAEVNTKNDLVISLESFGQMPAEDMFKESIGALKKDLGEIKKKIK